MFSIKNLVKEPQILEYIRQNPVKAKLVSEAESYPFSSFYEPPASDFLG